MKNNELPPPPFPRTWWIEPGRVLGGPYPGDLDAAVAENRLAALLDIGVRRVICLQQADEPGRNGRPFVNYQPLLQRLAVERGVVVDWKRHPIPDMGVPDDGTMRAILDDISAAVGVVYVHCWGGHGRTGTVAGCWLVRRGLDPDEALARIRANRVYDAHLADYPSPQTDAQESFVRRWADRARHPDRETERRLGAVLGLAVGDAFGTTLEFSHPGPRPWSPLLGGPHVDVSGGGPFDLLPGQVTDDTQMACCLASGISTTGGFDAADAGARYVTWAGHAFDIGSQTRAALTVLRRHGDPAVAGLEVWRRGGRGAAGNGSLMRTTPIGALIDDPAARRDAAMRDSAITHADPRCCLACAAFNAAVAAAIHGATGPAMTEAAEIELAAAVPLLAAWWPEEQETIAQARADLAQDLRLAREPDPALYQQPDLQGGAAGFVRVALRAAFWELLHARDYAAGLVDIVNRGGDADTNGSITGALLGARCGVHGIPERWLDRVMSCTPPAPWGGVYHPRVLREAVTMVTAAITPS